MTVIFLGSSSQYLTRSRRFSRWARLAKGARKHLVLMLPISAAGQDFGSAKALLARADIANKAFDRESAPHTGGVQVPYLDAVLSGFH